MTTDVITRRRLRELVADGGGPGTRVSLYLATHRRGPEAEFDRLRFRHLVDDAREKVLALGRDRPREVDALLEPARRAWAEEELWRGRGDGVALFLGPGGARSLRLPLSPQSQAVAGERFYVRPLLPLLHGRGRFYVLGLSRRRARLLGGDPTRVWEVESLALPQGTDVIERYEDPEQTIQLHTATPHGRAGHGRDALFHGHGGVGTDDPKVVTQSYCRLVDRALRRLLEDERRPLVLAGERSLLAQFRSVSAYPSLVEKALAGSPDRASAERLHARALELVTPIFAAERREALERYEEASVLAVCDLDRIVAEAAAGRIGLLFVAEDREVWGRPAPAPPPARAELHDAWQPGDVGLLDFAAAETLQHGGDVYAVPADEVPSGGPAAALLRY